jgi:hypothetical protein
MQIRASGGVFLKNYSITLLHIFCPVRAATLTVNSTAYEGGNIGGLFRSVTLVLRVNVEYLSVPDAPLAGNLRHIIAWLISSHSVGTATKVLIFYAYRSFDLYFTVSTNA